jgi:hypothetical protein
MHGMFILRLSLKVRGNQKKQNIMGWRLSWLCPKLGIQALGELLFFGHV